MERSLLRCAVHCASLLVVLLFLFPAYLNAQSSTKADQSARGRFLGLQQAVELALTTHPLLQEASANLKASEARTEQARSLYYPQVYANANTVAGAGRSVADASATSSLSTSKDDRVARRNPIHPIRKPRAATIETPTYTPDGFRASRAGVTTLSPAVAKRATA